MGGVLTLTGFFVAAEGLDFFIQGVIATGGRSPPQANCPL
jgi:hypothetical protein